MSNKQTQMAVGIADLPNAIFYKSKLNDGSETRLTSRTLACRLKELISQTYPKLGRQASQILLPTFLNVTDGLLEDDNDGSSTYNSSHVSVEVDLIRRILAANKVSKVHIGVVTMYPGQF